MQWSTAGGGRDETPMLQWSTAGGGRDETPMLQWSTAGGGRDETPMLHPQEREPGLSGIKFDWNAGASTTGLRLRGTGTSFEWKLIVIAGD